MEMGDPCCCRDRDAEDSLACTRHARCRSSCRGGSSAGASDALCEENLWLAQQLAIGEAHARRWQERVRALRRELRAVEQQHANERVQWQRAMAEKERKWTREYDAHMQSLLQIIAHHEATQRTLLGELEAQRTRAEAVAMSTQTEPVATVESGQQTQCDGVERCCLETRNDQSIVAEMDRQVHATRQEIETIDSTPEPIHEQYAALTMQKLLEQLRHSNAQSANKATIAPISPPERALPVPTSFRDSILKRLAGSTDPIAQRSKGPRGLAPKLPVLHEQEEIVPDPPSHLRYPLARHYLSPSAA